MICRIFKVKLLEEEIRELEALQEVHEQLIESNHELEMDLREELDMAQAAKGVVIFCRNFSVKFVQNFKNGHFLLDAT